MLVSVDGGPFASVFPPDAPVGPSATAGAGLFPAMTGDQGCVVEWSMRGELGLARPSPAYAPFDQARARQGRRRRAGQRNRGTEGQEDPTPAACCEG